MTTTEQETKSAGYADCPTQRIDAANDIVYAYRDVGAGDVPLVLLQHFRGNLDNWDPVLVDDLSATRRVVTFNNRGVASTSGLTPNTVEEMPLGYHRWAPRCNLSGVGAAEYLEQPRPEAAFDSLCQRHRQRRRRRYHEVDFRHRDARVE